MAVIFLTPNPKSLLTNFVTRIQQTAPTGKITTWEVNNNGDFTHKASQWASQAWFRPVVGGDRLTFNIIKPQNKDVSGVVYAYYHGHLIETFLNHFDKEFSAGSATALSVPGDHCN